MHPSLLSNCTRRILSTYLSLYQTAKEVSTRMLIEFPASVLVLIFRCNESEMNSLHFFPQSIWFNAFAYPDMLIKVVKPLNTAILELSPLHTTHVTYKWLDNNFHATPSLWTLDVTQLDYHLYAAVEKVSSMYSHRLAAPLHIIAVAIANVSPQCRLRVVTHRLQTVLSNDSGLSEWIYALCRYSQVQNCKWHLNPLATVLLSENHGWYFFSKSYRLEIYKVWRCEHVSSWLSSRRPIVIT